MAENSATHLEFSERLSRKVLASLKSLNESLGEVRLSVQKIDSIASTRLSAGGSPSHLSRASFYSSGAASVPTPRLVLPPAAPALGVPLPLLKRLLLAPALRGSGLDEGLLAELGGVLDREELDSVKDHVAFRPRQDSELAHGEKHSHNAVDGHGHTPIVKSPRPHTPPPTEWHPHTGSGKEMPRVQPPAVPKLTLMATAAVPAPHAAPSARWFTFPRYDAEPCGGPAEDDGADAIPYAIDAVPEEEFEALKLAHAAEGFPAARVLPGVVPGDHATLPDEADAFTVLDDSHQPLVKDWMGGDLEWGNGAPEELDAAARGKRFEAFALRVVYQAGRTGFEDAKEFSAEPGEVLAGRYKVNSFLGAAAFSTAVSCTDLTSGDEVALKIIKNNKDFVDQSLDEIKLLRYLNAQGDPDSNRVLRLKDYFYHREHLFLVTELLKDNLYDWQSYVETNELEPYFTLPRVQRIARQMLQALAFIHENGLLHCDLKPENVLVVSYSRAPEVVLGLPYGPKIDVWSLGCILTELLTGKVLFPNESVQTMLVRMQSLLGPLPAYMVADGGDASKFLTPAGLVYEAAGEEDEGLEAGNIKLMRPVPTNLGIRSGSSDPLWLDFIASILCVDPAHRPSAAQALKHPWMKTVLEFEPYVMP